MEEKARLNKKAKYVYAYMYYTSHGPTSQGKNIVVKAAKYSRENLEGGIITFICIHTGASAVSSR
jgi:hypothetical protein